MCVYIYIYMLDGATTVSLSLAWSRENPQQVRLFASGRSVFKDSVSNG